LGFLEEHFAAQSVPIEMDHMKGLALRLGGAQSFRELFKGRGTQDFQMKRLARRIGQPANEMPSDGAERNPVTFQAADHEQDPDLACGRPGGFGRSAGRE